MVSSLIETGISYTYYNEESIEKMDYFRHIRNFVVYSKCNYFSEDKRNFIVFKDSMQPKQYCIKVECYKVGTILMELQKHIIEYYNDNHN